jgi:hypothetical protein
MSGAWQQYALLIAASTSGDGEARPAFVREVELALCGVTSLAKCCSIGAAPGPRTVKESIAEFSEQVKGRPRGTPARLLIYLHCHGTPKADWSDSFQFHFPGGYMTFGELREAIMRAEVDSVVLVVEACHSGQIANLIKRQKIGHKLAVLHSSAAGELSDDGPFTQAFVQVIRDMGMGAERDLLLKEVGERVQKRLPDRRRDEEKRKQPVPPPLWYSDSPDCVLLWAKGDDSTPPESPEALGSRMFKILMRDVPQRPDLAETALLWLYATGDLRALGWSASGPSHRPGQGAPPSGRTSMETPPPRDEIALLRRLLGLPEEAADRVGVGSPVSVSPLNRLNLCRFLCWYAEALRSDHGNPAKAEEILSWVMPWSRTAKNAKLSDEEWGRLQPAPAATRRRVWITVTFDHGHAVDEQGRVQQPWLVHASLQIPHGFVPLVSQHALPVAGIHDGAMPELRPFVALVLAEVRKLIPVQETRVVWDFLLEPDQAHWRIEDVAVSLSQNDQDGPSRLAEEYACQLRLRQRHAHAGGVPVDRWRKKGADLQATGGTVAPGDCTAEADVAEATTPDEIRGVLREHAVLLAPGFFADGHPDRCGVQTEAQLFGKLFESGVVSALWIRPGETVAPGARSQWESVLFSAKDRSGQPITFSDWPAQIRSHRYRSGWRHLAFVYDPPEPRLRLGAQYSPDTQYDVFDRFGYRRTATAAD